MEPRPRATATSATHVGRRAVRPLAGDRAHARAQRRGDRTGGRATGCSTGVHRRRAAARRRGLPSPARAGRGGPGAGPPARNAAVDGEGPRQSGRSPARRTGAPVTGYNCAAVRVCAHGAANRSRSPVPHRRPRLIGSGRFRTADGSSRPRPLSAPSHSKVDSVGERRSLGTRRGEVWCDNLSVKRMDLTCSARLGFGHGRPPGHSGTLSSRSSNLGGGDRRVRSRRPQPSPQPACAPPSARRKRVCRRSSATC